MVVARKRMRLFRTAGAARGIGVLDADREIGIALLADIDHALVAALIDIGRAVGASSAVIAKADRRGRTVGSITRVVALVDGRGIIHPEIGDPRRRPARLLENAAGRVGL